MSHDHDTCGAYYRADDDQTRRCGRPTKFVSARGGQGWCGIHARAYDLPKP